MGGAGRCAPCARCWRGGVPSCHSGGPARVARCGSGSGGVRGRTRRLAAAPRAEGAGGCRSDTGGAPDLRSAPGPTHHSTPKSCEVNPLPVPSTVDLAVDRASSRRKRPDSVTTGPGLSNRAGFDPAGIAQDRRTRPRQGYGYGPVRAGTLDTARRANRDPATLRGPSSLQPASSNRFGPFQAAFSRGTRTPPPVFHESARPCCTMPAAHLLSPLWVTVS